MYPDLFSIGPFSVHSFGLMMAIAFIAAGISAYYEFRRKGLDTESIYWLVIAAAVGGLVGSKINYLIQHPDELRDSPLTAAFSGAGLVWYGGVIGGAIAAFLVVKLYRLSWIKVLDAAAPAMAIGYAFGRIGCFLNGDDYGQPSHLPWALQFPKGSPPTPPGIAVQPTQLYESFSSVVIFLILMYVLRGRLKRPGAMISAYLVMAGTERFLVEFVRMHRDGQLQAQVISVIVAVLAAGALVLIYKRRPQDQDQPDPAR